MYDPINYDAIDVTREADKAVRQSSASSGVPLEVMRKINRSDIHTAYLRAVKYDRMPKDMFQHWLKGWTGKSAFAKRNPLFLPKIFDSYIVKTSDGKLTVDRIQTLGGAEKKAKELLKKYPCVGVSILSKKHGTVIKEYKAAMGKAPKVATDNTREYAKEAKGDEKFVLYVDGSEFATYDTKREAEKAGRDEGGRWRVKKVVENPNADEFLNVPNTKFVEMFGTTHTRGNYGKTVGRLMTSLTLARTMVKKPSATSVGAKIARVIDSTGKTIGYHMYTESVQNPVNDAAFQAPLILRDMPKGSEFDAMRDKLVYSLGVTRGDANDMVEEYLQKEHLDQMDKKRLGKYYRRNPVVSGTGEVLDTNDDHDSAPYVNVLDKYGYTYSHSVPVVHAGNNRVIHHVWKTYRSRGIADRPDLKDDFNVSAWVGNSGWQWQAGKGGSNSGGKTGRTAAELDRYLKGLMGRIGRVGNPSVPQTDYDFKMQVKQIASEQERYTSSKAVENRIRELYKNFRTYMLSKGHSAKDYPNWAPSQKMPGWIAEPFYDALQKHMQTEGYRAGRRNPGTSSDRYEEFHGKPSTKEVIYETEEFEREHFAELGDLIQLKVATATKKDAVIDAPNPDVSDIDTVVKLACSPDGKQLFFIGGDQELDLKSLGFTNAMIKDHMLVGVLYELTYRTAKGFHKFKVTDYFHELGEETGDQPVLLYNPQNKSLSVAGGAYEVKDVGICN